MKDNSYKISMNMFINSLCGDSDISIKKKDFKEDYFITFQGIMLMGQYQGETLDVIVFGNEVEVYALKTKINKGDLIKVTGSFCKYITPTAQGVKYKFICSHKRIYLDAYVNMDGKIVRKDRFE